MGRLRIALYFLLICMLLGFVQSQSWTHHTILDPAGNYHLYWNPPVDNKGDSEIEFRVEVKTNGLIGLGFSIDGGFPESDFVTGWIKDGEVYFQDRHIDADNMAIVDEQQDYQLMSSNENDTHTVFEFRRKLDTCDVNDMVIHGGTMRIIYSFSNEDPSSEDPFSPTENTGMKSVVLLKGNKDPDLDYSTLSTWEISAGDADISSSEMFFWCKIVKSPEVSEKNHIVSIQPFVQEGNEQYVFYMILYECFGGTSEEYEDLTSSGGYQCYDPNNPEPTKMCKAFTTIWATGEKGLELPEHVGFPIDPDRPRYYAFEIGYNNPQRDSITDNSGLRVYYTSVLREHDAGNFLIGVPHSPRVFIPPAQNEYLVVGHSNPQCLSVFPPDGIKAVGIIPHLHLNGRGKKARHFRGNEELAPLVDETNYDIMIQEFRFFQEEIDILPDDEITMECRYNTAQKTNVTFGGQMITDEMCLAIIMYYPLVDGYASLSVPTYETINQALNTEVTNEEEIYEVLGAYNWADADIKKIENTMVNSPQNSQCHFGPFGEEDAANNLVSYPSDFTPYESESTCS